MRKRGVFVVYLYFSDGTGRTYYYQDMRMAWHKMQLYGRRKKIRCEVVARLLRNNKRVCLSLRNYSMFPLPITQTRRKLWGLPIITR